MTDQAVVFAAFVVVQSQFGLLALEQAFDTMTRQRDPQQRFGRSVPEEVLHVALRQHVARGQQVQRIGGQAVCALGMEGDVLDFPHRRATVVEPVQTPRLVAQFRGAMQQPVEPFRGRGAGLDSRRVHRMSTVCSAFGTRGHRWRSQPAEHVLGTSAGFAQQMRTLTRCRVDWPPNFPANVVDYDLLDKATLATQFCARAVSSRRDSGNDRGGTSARNAIGSTLFYGKSDNCPDTY